MSKMVEGKVVVITGAGGGIGRDFALAFARSARVTRPRFRAKYRYDTYPCVIREGLHSRPVEPAMS